MDMQRLNYIHHLPRNLAAPVIVNHARPTLQIRTDLLLAAAALARQILRARGLGVRMPPGVAEHIPGGDALLGVEQERLDEQVDAVGADGAEAAHVPVLAVDGELGGHRVLGELADAGPVVVGRGANGLADEADLVELVGAGHVGRAQDELGKDGADGPDVDGARVVLGAKEQLGRAVPARDDVGRHVLVRVGEAARKAEIGKLDLAVGGNEQIVGLDVAVQHKGLVAEPHGAGQHAHPGLDVGGAVAHVVGVADQHLQVAEGQELEHQVEILVLGREDGQERDDVGVFELAHGVGSHALGVFFLYFNLFDGDLLRGVRSQMAEKHNGSNLSETLPKIRQKVDSIPLTYLRFSSSFICSATSSVGGSWGADVGVGLGVPFDDEFVPDAKFLKGDPMARIDVPSFDCVVVTTGDNVMLTTDGLGCVCVVEWHLA
ncbi:hypothetical protein BM221_006113 [Beauveria bassiana]|uniref:Uncharacterized protein n=1 Tax=Beauveria bassiana TaxID=176275 RepID=A0A2N6NKX8_BEABA|nr:hypothetical protein BM221_006113 [Beauveria bassiana]